MPWLIVDCRDRGLLVSGAEAGHPTFTRDPARALKFTVQGQARRWVERETMLAFGALLLMRAPGSRDTRRGQADHYGPRA